VAAAAAAHPAVQVGERAQEGHQVSRRRLARLHAPAAAPQLLVQVAAGGKLLPTRQAAGVGASRMQNRSGVLAASAAGPHLHQHHRHCRRTCTSTTCSASSKAA
jgi:hypothetical protein